MEKSLDNLLRKYQNDTRVLLVGPESYAFRVHASMLAKSPFFRYQLDKSSNNAVFTIAKTSPKVFAVAMEYLYSGNFGVLDRSKSVQPVVSAEPVPTAEDAAIRSNEAHVLAEVFVLGGILEMPPMQELALHNLDLICVCAPNELLFDVMFRIVERGGASEPGFRSFFTSEVGEAIKTSTGRDRRYLSKLTGEGEHFRKFLADNIPEWWNEPLAKTVAHP